MADDVEVSRTRTPMTLAVVATVLATFALSLASVLVLRRVPGIRRLV